MIKSFEEGIQITLDVQEVNPDPKLVKLPHTDCDFNDKVMTMKLVTGTLIAVQLVGCRKTAFNHKFKVYAF